MFAQERPRNKSTLFLVLLRPRAQHHRDQNMSSETLTFRSEPLNLGDGERLDGELQGEEKSKIKMLAQKLKSF